LSRARAAAGILSAMPLDSYGPAGGATPTAAPIPPLLHGQPPLALLVDYDGTISQVDVSEQLLTRFFARDWHDDDVDYAEGRIGSRTFFRRQMPSFEGRYEDVVAFAASQPHDAAFAPFVAAADRLEVPVEVVSDGLGFFIDPALERLGVPHVPVVAALTTFDGRDARMTFPNGHPDCLVCGTCKRQRVMAHQAAGRAVVFIGDGESDRYAAAYSDVIFAKGDLIAMCRAEGWPFTPWEDFAEIQGWLDATVAAWRTDPAAIAPPRARPFICGPELWGPGRTNPPARG
jgi:2-hydroxy-3-keto-5-methylthiopentenyl-1-phosphate phosphatase